MISNANATAKRDAIERGIRDEEEDVVKPESEAFLKSGWQKKLKARAREGLNFESR